MPKVRFLNLENICEKNGLIDEAVCLVDGTKILLTQNKYSFVWKKNTIRYDDLNRQKAKSY